jgi:UDP-N-acetylglucosamine acyltransferase
MIHPTAVVEPGATVAPDVRIGPFSRIGSGVRVGPGVRIEAHTVIEGPVTLEANVRVFSCVKIGNGRCPVTVGANTFIREFSQIGNQTDSDAPLTIAPDNFFMAYVQLFPGVRLGAGCVLTNAVTLLEGARCEERVIVGGLTSVAEGCTIGTGVMVGGASNLRNDVPPFCLVEGNPATVKGLNVIGMRRRFDDSADIESVKRIFKELYDAFDAEQAALIRDTLDNPQAERFAAFIATHRCGTD